MKFDDESYRSISEETDSSARGMDPLVSGCPPEPIESGAAHESAEKGGCFVKHHLNEETLKVIRDAERGIGLFGPFDSVEHMLNSLLDEDED